MVGKLRAEGRGAVPDFDPMDGGVNARLLFLLEKPGPMTDPYRPGRRGSGFISRDNDDQSAEALFGFMNEARIPREETLLWNVIPWWNGTIRLTPDERREGLARLDDLLDLLPRLEGVVLVGQKAAKARPILEKRRLPVWISAHPSPRVRARYPDRFRQIPHIWAQAASHLRSEYLTDAEINAARERGRIAQQTEPRASSARYDQASRRIIIELTSGCTFSFPPEIAQGLEGATEEELAAVEILGAGYGLHWEALDADLSVPGLLAGRFGTKAFMARRADHAGKSAPLK